MYSSCNFVRMYFTKRVFQLFLFQAFQAASKYEKAIRNDKHIMSFAIYELAVIHISRDEVMNYFVEMG